MSKYPRQSLGRQGLGRHLQPSGEVRQQPVIGVHLSTGNDVSKVTGRRLLSVALTRSQDPAWHMQHAPDLRQDDVAVRQENDGPRESEVLIGKLIPKHRLP